MTKHVKFGKSGFPGYPVWPDSQMAFRRKLHGFSDSLMGSYNKKENFMSTSNVPSPSKLAEVQKKLAINARYCLLNKVVSSNYTLKTEEVPRQEGKYLLIDHDLSIKMETDKTTSGVFEIDEKEKTLKVNASSGLLRVEETETAEEYGEEGEIISSAYHSLETFPPNGNSVLCFHPEGKLSWESVDGDAAFGIDGGWISETVEKCENACG